MIYGQCFLNIKNFIISFKKYNNEKHFKTTERK